ncbi:MAG: DUF3750 domain-containing protein [Planctomycetes bacterium]|nr:DUF3750 domain-containing protein [Planctomycetota bacterium]
MKFKLAAFSILALAVNPSCVTTPAELSYDNEFMVIVKSHRAGEEIPFNLANHALIDCKDGSEEKWSRFEWGSSQETKLFPDAEPGQTSSHTTVYIGAYEHPLTEEEAREEIRWESRVLVHKVITGSEAQGIIQQLRVETEAYPFSRSEHYVLWPGPNSNTYVDNMGRAIDGFDFLLSHNCIGKDYQGPIYIGPSTTGKGAQIETAYIGLQIGLIEGFELHLLGSTWGIGTWPLALKIPFLPKISLW